MKYPIHTALCALSLVTLLFACGDDAGDEGNDALEVTEVRFVESAAAVAGHEILVEAIVQSNAEIQDLNIMFFMVRNAAAEELPVLLGSTFLDVGVGEVSVQQWVTIPEELSNLDGWVLQAQADPQTIVAEGKRNNNSNGIAMPIAAPGNADPDIVLQDAICDRCDGQLVPLRETTPAIVVDTQLLVMGPNPVADVEVTVTLDIPDDGQDAAGNGVVGLEIWNSDTETFETSIRVAEIVPGESTPLHLMLRLPEPLRTALNSHPGVPRWEAEMEIAVNPTGAITEDEERFKRLRRDDNRISMSVVLEQYLPEDLSGSDSVVFNERFTGNTRTMPWPLNLGYLMQPSQAFLIRLQPDVTVRGHAGKFSGAHLEAAGNLRHQVFPGWFAEPEVPAAEFEFVFDADKDDLSASVYSLDLKVNGDPVDVMFVEDFSDCSLEEISIPIVLTDESPTEGEGVCSKDVTPEGCEIEFIGFRIVLLGGMRASMDIGIAACEDSASTATDASLNALLTRHNTASMYMTLLAGGDQVPIFGDDLLLGVEQEIDIIDERESMIVEGSAGRPGSASFPNGGGELSFESRINTGFIGSSLSYVIGLEEYVGLCVTPSLSVNGIETVKLEIGDCDEKKLSLDSKLLLSFPPLFQNDTVVTPRTTYRFDFN